jgi:lambda repressor-like predicted transcriptional regulator
MTAKEKLATLLSSISEEEAQRLIDRLEEDPSNPQNAGEVKKITEDDGGLTSETLRQERTLESPPKSLDEIIAEIHATVPEEVWEQVPSDLSEQHDYYLYGSSKHGSGRS